MNFFLFSILCCFLFATTAHGQKPLDSTVAPVIDSSVQQDTTVLRDTVFTKEGTDSFSKQPPPDRNWKMPTGISIFSPQFGHEIQKRHPYFGFKTKALIPPPSMVRKVNGKELLFYGLIFLVIVFAVLRRAFSKYFTDLFRLFFRTTLKQRQIREQLIQTPLPSLLLNVFFVISGGLYIAFLLQHFRLSPVNNFWLLSLYCCLGLSAAYCIKFTGLKISGWLFSMTDAADAYIFIVFIVNKMMGILLLPFLILLAFSTGYLYTVSLTLSVCLIAGLLGYRFILTYAAIRNQVKVNPFHFFLYLLAFEIVPLLLVYKGLLLFFGITA